jgi:hypothetical protein
MPVLSRGQLSTGMMERSLGLETAQYVQDDMI